MPSFDRRVGTGVFLITQKKNDDSWTNEKAVEMEKSEHIAEIIGGYNKHDLVTRWTWWVKKQRC